MEKIIVCFIPNFEDVEEKVFNSKNEKMTVSKKPFYYAVNSFLENDVDNDNRKYFLIAQDSTHISKLNIEKFKAEIKNPNYAVEEVYMDSKDDINNSLLNDIEMLVDISNSSFDQFLNCLCEFLGEASQSFNLKIINTDKNMIFDLNDSLRCSKMSFHMQKTDNDNISYDVLLIRNKNSNCWKVNIEKQ